jgi:hypothetical protein
MPLGKRVHVRGDQGRDLELFAWTEADDRWLLALAAAGWTQGMAANEMDRPIGTVWRHSKVLGLRWPSSHRSRKGASVAHPGTAAAAPAPTQGS